MGFTVMQASRDNSFIVCMCVCVCVCVCVCCFARLITVEDDLASKILHDLARII